METFLIRNPVLEEQGSRCTFDVTPRQFVQLRDGTPETMRALLSAIGCRQEPLDWSIAPFCTPYYADNPRAPDWRDRIRLAWRVSVRLAAPPTAIDEKWLFLALPCTATDPTWKEQDDSWDWSALDCVVIGDCVGKHYSEAQQALADPSLAPPHVRSVEAVRLHPEVVQVRCGLGRVQLPDDEPRIKEVLRACSRWATSLLWRDSLQLGNIIGR